MRSKYRLGPKYFQIRHCRRARNRISRIGMSVPESARRIIAAKSFKYLFRHQRRAQCQKSSRNSFRHAHHIRRNSGQLARKHRAASAKSGEHFIRNQQNIMLRPSISARAAKIPRDARSFRPRLAAAARRSQPQFYLRAQLKVFPANQRIRCCTIRASIRPDSDSNTPNARDAPENAFAANAAVNGESSLTDIAPAVSP